MKLAGDLEGYKTLGTLILSHQLALFNHQYDLETVWQSGQRAKTEAQPSELSSQLYLWFPVQI